MQLKPNTLLQGGKYRIVKELGSGGFGITYKAVQVSLNRYVAIKEFFMKDFCVRGSSSTQMSVGSEGSRKQVERYRKKFVKEARTIAQFKHPHIIGIHDVFEENGTAYYVMDFLEEGSLNDYLKKQGRLSETEALYYIRQIASALDYIHQQNINHLDVKPGNIMLDENHNAVLIDFGLAKSYDGDGNQESTTPVGVSAGYAPTEQYMRGGVGKFSPETDIYSLGATLYKLVTGKTPPEAQEVTDYGLPTLPSFVSEQMAAIITHAMQPRRVDRPHDIEEFLWLVGMLHGNSSKKDIVNTDDTYMDDEPNSDPSIDKPIYVHKKTVKTTSRLTDSVKNAGKQTAGGEKVENTQEKSKWKKIVPIVVALSTLLVYEVGVKKCGNASKSDINDWNTPSQSYTISDEIRQEAEEQAKKTIGDIAMQIVNGYFAAVDSTAADTAVVYDMAEDSTVVW